MLNLSWKVRCNFFCQSLTACRSPCSLDFLTSDTLFFSLTFSLFSQLCTLSFTSTFISSLNSTHVPKTFLALVPFPSLLINLSTIAEADESVLRDSVLDSELLVAETQTFASDFRFLPRQSQPLLGSIGNVWNWGLDRNGWRWPWNIIVSTDVI